MSDIVIRSVKPDDVASLHRNCFPRSTDDDVHRLVEASLRGMLDDRSIHLVADDDGEIVGTVELAILGARARHRGQLSRFVVAESHRGRGMARALLARVLDESERLGIEMIDASARAGTSAEDVFRKLGFVEFGRLPGGLVMEDQNEVYDLVFFYLPVEQARADRQ
ncbi:MAG: N-acetyltransferase family protein [Actinomycetota bacterium]